MPVLILTLRLDPDAQAFFERLRQLHFPPERNLIPAHLTLFHQLPDSATVTATLSQAAGAQPRFPLQIVGPRGLGNGVAYQLSSAVLVALHATLAEAFAPDLIAQDKQRFQPHVVVQNKVSPEQARRLLEQLRISDFPKTAQACGMDLWQYHGGPWRYLRTFPFLRPPQASVSGSSP